MPVDVPAERPRVEPVFNTFRRQPLRPFYSLREFQIGWVTLIVLAAVAGWVVWRGAHPDPHLFVVSEKLLTDKGKDIPVYERPLAVWVEPGHAAPAAGNTHGPFPESVLADGWRAAAPPQMFDESNLYSKIDGRESFYKSYGFKRLVFLSLAANEPAGLSIDIEMFDLEKSENALGAFSGEVSNPQTAVTVAPTGLWYITRNSGFIAQGRHYVRLIGSDDSEAVRRKITALKDTFIASLPGEPLPWAYALFVGRLKISPSRIQYAAENAFSFGFADRFYSAALPESETEVFVSRRASTEEAGLLATKLFNGFTQYGKKLPGDAPLIHNEYTGRIDGARSQGIYVLGVRLAPAKEEAALWLDRLAGEVEQIR